MATAFIGTLLCLAGLLLAVNFGLEASPQQMLYGIIFYGGAAIGIAGVLWLSLG